MTQLVIHPQFIRLEKDGQTIARVHRMQSGAWGRMRFIGGFLSDEVTEAEAMAWIRAMAMTEAI